MIPKRGSSQKVLACKSRGKMGKRPRGGEYMGKMLTAKCNREAMRDGGKAPVAGSVPNCNCEAMRK